MRAADLELPGGIDVVLGVLVDQVRRHDVVDHGLPDLLAQLGLARQRGSVHRIMLSRNHHGINADRLAAFVLHGDLGLAVRAQELQQACLADLGETLHQLVGEHDRQRHQRIGFATGEAEHQPLVAGPAGVDAHGDVSRLLVEMRLDRASAGVKPVGRVVVADLANRVPRDLLKVQRRTGSDFASDHAQVSRYERLACNPAERVFG